MNAKVAALIASAALLVFFVVYCIFSMHWTAPTFDEGAHLPAGYLQLATGRVLLNPEHPPLAKLLAAVPVRVELGAGAAENLLRAQGDQWELGRMLLYGSGRSWGEILNPARMITVGFGVLLCVVSAVWAFQLGGWLAALITLSLCVFCPTLLAHSRLVTTDIPVAACAVLASFLGWRFSSRPSAALAIALGLALGATVLTKFSGVIFAATVFILLVGSAAVNKDKRSRIITGSAVSAVVIAACIPLVYGDLSGFSQFLYGMSMLGHNHQPGFKIFLLGDYQAGGYWWYFPAAFLLKSSPAVLVGIILALILSLSRTRQSNSRGIDIAFVIIPFLAYAIFIACGAPQFGVRYVIPCMPFIFILLGVSLAPIAKIRFGSLLLLCLLLVHANAAVLSYPDPISYFNGLLGCKRHEAVRCLDDSNFDWGQDLGRAAEFVAALEGAPAVRLLYFGTADPSAFFKEWAYMEPEEFLSPSPGVYVMSLQMLQRFTRLGGVPEKLLWERRFKPRAYIGNTYAVYDFRR